MPQTLESLIEKEFQEVSKTREDLLAKRQEIDDQLRALDLRHTAALNYKATLEGKFAAPAQGPRKPRAPTTGRAPRGKRAEIRKRILDVIRSFTEDGATGETINAELQATEKKDRQAIANLLARMKADNVITQEAPRQPYKIARAGQEPQPEAP